MLDKSQEWYRNNVIELPGVDGDKTSPHKSQIDANKRNDLELFFPRTQTKAIPGNPQQRVDEPEGILVEADVS